MVKAKASINNYLENQRNEPSLVVKFIMKVYLHLLLTRDLGSLQSAQHA